MMNDIIVKIFSDTNDISYIEKIVKQLNDKGFLLKIILSKNFLFENEDILIFQIYDIKSKYFNKIINTKNKIANDIIFVTSKEDALLVSSIIKQGFNNIFILPFESYGLYSTLQELITKKSDQLPIMKMEKDISSYEKIIGNSDEIEKIINLSKRIAKNTTSNILIRGETGTGKGLLAKTIHKYSKKFNGSFVEIVCSSLPEHLLESELFGYEEGAFTNAQNLKRGLFELAEGGTIFLDEIGDLSFNVQKKLLRVLENKVIRRLGAIKDTPINARIITSTNMNLEELVEQNKFRQDLYHRLNVVAVEIPPLRERTGDIMILVEYFINMFSKQFNKEIKGISEEVKQFLKAYKWPGNVRELRNVIERAVLLTNNVKLELNDFAILNNIKVSKHINNTALYNLDNLINIQLDITKTPLYKLEKIYAKEVYEKMYNNKTKTSQILGISRPKLDSLLG